MTCIVAISQNGKVYIGADSAGAKDCGDITIRADEKVFIKDSFIFGFTSSFRMGQLLQYALSIPGKPQDIDDKNFIYTLFIDSVRKCLKDGGYSEIDKNKEVGGIFIFGYKGKIYKVESDFQIGQSLESFDACGCGEDYAKAILYITNNSEEPEKRIIKALQTAEHFNAFIRGPFKILSL